MNDGLAWALLSSIGLIIFASFTIGSCEGRKEVCKDWKGDRAIVVNNKCEKIEVENK